MADRLTIYRGALRLLGDAHSLSSLTEEGPARRALDAAWRPCGDFMLEQGLWNFAIRSVEIHADENLDVRFGYDHAFSKPDDWVRTAGISALATFEQSYEDYEDEEGYWYGNQTPLYVRYVSNDTAWGWNVGRWRQHFAKAMECYLAFECGLPISADKGNRNDLFSLYEKRLKEAKTKDAVDERVRKRPVGRLVRSRFGPRRSRMEDR